MPFGLNFSLSRTLAFQFFDFERTNVHGKNYFRNILDIYVFISKTFFSQFRHQM
jgi:hypothetical protein